MTSHPARRAWRAPLLLALATGLVLAGVAAVSAAHQFDDVDGDHPFHDQIGWLAEEGIAEGYGDGTFGPGRALTRQAVAAFLYRLAGEPATSGDGSGFSDVGEDHAFATPIAWLAEEEIADGYADGTFGPGRAVTRQAAAAFLHRLAGEPMVEGDGSGFTDVDGDHPFAEAIGWMSEAEIAEGYGDGTFRPAHVVTRQAAAAFLHRFEGEPVPGPTPEVRGWWVHLFDDTLRSAESIDAMLDEAAASGANTVIAQVARRQDAVYDSDLLPRLPEPDLPDDLDVLAELVDGAHERGMQIHAWASVLPAHHPAYDDLELDEEHIWRTHGPDSDEPWVSYDVDGGDVVYLDPGVPGVQDHVAGALAEIAGNYDVDAVHVDYLRYDHGDIYLAGDDDSGVTGYNPIALQRFAERYDRDEAPAPEDEQWMDWRREQTRHLMRRIRAEVADADPGVAVSQAGVTWGQGPTSAGGFEHTTTHRWVFQDWPRWLREGAIDVAMPMNYFAHDDDSQRAHFDDWTRWQGELEHDGLLAVGQAGFLNEPDDSLAQLRRARMRTDGGVVYSHQLQTRQGDTLSGLLADSVWAEPAPAPDLLGEPTGGHVIVTTDDGEPVELSSGGETWSEHADATDRAVFLHIPPGTAHLDAPGYEPATVEVEAGTVHRLALTPDS